MSFTRWNKFSDSELREMDRALFTLKAEGTQHNKQVTKSLESELTDFLASKGGNV